MSSSHTLWSCLVILLLRRVEGPLLKSLTSLKLLADDPCADEKTSPSEASSSRIRFIHRSSEQSRYSYSFEEVHAAANKYFRDFEYERALRCYHKAVEKNAQQYAKVYRNRGLCSSRLSLHTSAIEDYRKSLEIEPESIRGRYFLGREYYETGEADESERQLKKALRFGEEHNMMGDEKWQIVSLINRARQKKRETERQEEILRHERLLEYLKKLMFEDTKSKIFNARSGDEEDASDADKKVEQIVSNLDKYLDELNAAFAAVDGTRKLASTHPVPEYMCDTISLAIMKEPVIAPSGVSYETSQIMQIVEAGDSRDPATRARLTAEDLRPNKALKAVIQDYMKMNGLIYDDDD